MSFCLIPINVEGSGVQSVIKRKISFKDMCITQQKGRIWNVQQGTADVRQQHDLSRGDPEQPVQGSHTSVI